MVRFFSELPAYLVGLVASGSAHHWARVLRGLGNTVRSMPPQFAEPYVRSQKNDASDTEAIYETMARLIGPAAGPTSAERRACLSVRVSPLD